MAFRSLHCVTDANIKASMVPTIDAIVASFRIVN